jgi:subtilisin family serine protease
LADDTLNPTYIEQSNYIRAGGTSAAGPVVAGVAALYLQKNPTATCSQVKAAILKCPKTDSFTGVVPNNSYGYGKVDAFATLTDCISTGLNPSESKNLRLEIFPNPFSDQTIISYDLKPLGTYTSAEFKIYDIGGRIVESVRLTESVAQITLSRNNLQSGSYIGNLVIDGRIVKSEKIQIIR